MTSSSTTGVQIQQVQPTISNFDSKNNFAMWKYLMKCLRSNGYGEIQKKYLIKRKKPSAKQLQKVGLCLLVE